MMLSKLGGQVTFLSDRFAATIWPMVRFLIPVSILALAACSDPKTVCQQEATKDLGIVQALIADTQATIDRGYAIQTKERTVIYTDFCFGTGLHNGGFRFCNRAQPVVSRTPVAVDLNDERRKLRSLKQKESELKKRSLTALQQCEQAYPSQE